MLEHLDREAFEAGTLIFSEGEAGDCAYIIAEGAVEIQARHPNGDPFLRWLGKGELFGEIALIDFQARTATARAVEPCRLIPIRRSQIMELLGKSDPIIRHLLLLILERFRENIHVSTSAVPALSAAASTGDRHRLRGEATNELVLAHEIDNALSREEFEMHYQPICDLATGALAGYEALIRWKHPERGLVSPMSFLWLAERTGQIREIGLWTVDRACRDWPRLKERAQVAEPFVSVNLSANQLTGPDLVEELGAVLKRHAMTAASLKLELTETVIIDKPELASDLLGRLAALDIRLALDDYGTGYSGLDSLQRYPLATMKIDRVFVGSMTSTARSLDIVKSSIELAHSLGMDVIAEGIEDEATRGALMDLGCNLGQGWLFGRPAALAD